MLRTLFRRLRYRLLFALAPGGRVEGVRVALLTHALLAEQAERLRTVGEALGHLQRLDLLERLRAEFPGVVLGPGPEAELVEDGIIVLAELEKARDPGRLARRLLGAMARRDRQRPVPDHPENWWAERRQTLTALVGTSSTRSLA